MSRKKYHRRENPRAVLFRVFIGLLGIVLCFVSLCVMLWLSSMILHAEVGVTPLKLLGLSIMLFSVLAGYVNRDAAARSLQRFSRTLLDLGESLVQISDEQNPSDDEQD